MGALKNGRRKIIAHLPTVLKSEIIKEASGIICEQIKGHLRMLFPKSTADLCRHLHPCDFAASDGDGSLHLFFLQRQFCDCPVNQLYDLLRTAAQEHPLVGQGDFPCPALKQRAYDAPSMIPILRIINNGRLFAKKCSCRQLPLWNLRPVYPSFSARFSNASPSASAKVG